MAFDPVKTWSKEIGGGTVVFTSKGLGDPVSVYIHEAVFTRGNSISSTSRQSLEELTEAEVERRFADFLSEIR